MIRIIVADDEAMFLTMAEFILKKEGYDVKCVSSGEECLALYSQQGAELIMLDVLMHGESGFEVYERLRKQGAKVPVLFVTAADDADTIARVRSLGASFCRKPFTREELSGAVRAVLEKEVRQ